VNSVYGELLVPVFGAANALPGLRKLTLDIADRYDRYSDVGSTTNPKFGLDWAPIDSLTFRGSYGTSFRAPTIAQIYGNTNTLFVQNYSDPTCNCVIQGVTRSGGNLNLKPETATTYTAGVDFEPTWLSNSKFSLTYFDIDYKNQVVSYLADLTVLQREALFAGSGLITRNPSAALIAEQVAETHFTGVLPNPVLVFVDGRNLNLGRTLAKGIDLDFSYRVPQTALGNLQFGLSGTYFTSYLTSITANAPQLEVLNTIYNPLRFKARGTIGLTHAENSGALFINYVNSYVNTLATPHQTVGQYTTVDLHLAHTFPRNIVLSFDARDLFDTKPPFVNIAESANGGGGFDATVTNPIGRVASLGLSMTL
jgi:iron complex outermembrane receptor protein